MKIHGHVLPPNHHVGFLFSSVAAVLGCFLAFKGHMTYAGFCWVICLFLGILAKFRPDSLETLNKSWMYFGLVLSRVVNPVILGVIFFGLITPIGILGKIAGRDELRIRAKQPSPEWIERSPDKSFQNSLHLQY